MHDADGSQVWSSLCKVTLLATLDTNGKGETH